MKKLLASLLAGAMALSLVACGGGSSSAPAARPVLSLPALEATPLRPTALVTASCARSRCVWHVPPRYWRIRPSG